MLLLSVWAACPETWTTLLLLNYSAKRSVILCIQAWKDYEKMGPWTQTGKRAHTPPKHGLQTKRVTKQL